ncbi:MAG: TM2 domain-containing protein [Gammaproteobacteria bacterium]|nr:TM2 domain-containing protein [Pseudomonadota bacterium]TDJ38284.1 MAG: TM2 domain-containing protein [Gammaproteobacteria bacterium]
MSNDSHSLGVGYILWIFGFLGAHRFYFGRPVSGTLYLFTLGLFLIGWFVDLFLMPMLEASADRRYLEGKKNYTLGWVLLTFTGFLGLHRFYMGKIGTGLIYLFSLGLFGIGIIYDYWTLNEQISSTNLENSDR